MTTRSNPMGIPPHYYDLSVGAGHVDRYIGTSFDIVYEVYKRLPDFPVVLNFIQHWIPIMTELEPKVHDIVDNLHPDVVEKHSQIEIWHSETEQNKDLAEQARDAASGAMSHIGTLEGQMTNVLQRLAALEALNP